MVVSKALIIADPWIQLILSGEKIWEMRSTKNYFSGIFGLIKKGSGYVVGTARLTDVSGPYTSSQLLQHFANHKVPQELIERPDYKWWYAWHLSDVAALRQPVKYNHKNGAVTWVNLDETVGNQIQAQSGKAPNVVVDAEITESKKLTSVDHDAYLSTRDNYIISKSNYKHIPEAKDGTRFTQDKCSKNGVYTVGSKGGEKKFRNYIDALGYLRTMPVAKWRRPNSNGNWGIVSAVKWKELHDTPKT